MPSNNPEYQRRYKQKHYAANKQKYIDQAKIRKAILRKEIDEIKSIPCMDCNGQYKPWQMDFDHREKEGKLACIAKLVNDGKRFKVFEEIKKCDIVCANCHRDRTHRRNIEC